MPRYTISGDPISIAFGYESDPALSNVFLSVFDKRLEFQPDASEAVNAVTQQVGVGDGGGSYFDLHTGRMGFGIKVDHATMAVYLKRFGVSQEMIDKLPLSVPKTTAPEKKVNPEQRSTCIACGQNAGKTCDRCKGVTYCSESCQGSDWASHKLFCQLAPFPDDPPSTHGSSPWILGILLPAESKEPKLVKVPMEEGFDDGDYFRIPKLDEFLGEVFHTGIRSDFLPNRPFAHLPHTLHLHFRDGFMFDGSEKNRCVANVLGEERSEFAARWRGNLVVLKSVGGGNDPQYVSMGLSDTHDIGEFIFQYGLAS